MNTLISYDNISKRSRDAVEKLIRELAERHVERHLASRELELALLRAHLVRVKGRNRYEVKLRLGGLSDVTLTSEEESFDLAAAIRKSFLELERRLERQQSHLRGEASWRRKERREGLRRLKEAIADRPNNQAELFGDLVRPLLPALQRFVQRELAYLQARGDLTEDYPGADDVVDEVLARAYRRLDQRPNKLALQEWLYRIVIDVLAEEVARRQAEEGRFVSLHGKPPVELAQSGEDEEVALFEFWQPDEKLRLEDVLPGRATTPEEAVSEEEVRLYLACILAELPTAWRRAVLLSQAEGLSRSAVARELNASEQDIDRWLAHADAFLKAKLEEVGIRPGESGQPADYIAPGSLQAAPRLTRDLDEIISSTQPKEAAPGANFEGQSPGSPPSRASEGASGR